ncbi:MAG: response regulator transcription factor [Nitrospirota bacterium]
MSIKVFLADDHKMFRDGLKAQLDNVEGMVVVGEASDGREAVRMLEELKPDVAVLDVAMPMLNGIEATRNVLKTLPDLKIVMLSMLADQIYVVEALKAGANGYLLKEESFNQLIEAIKIVLSGKVFLSKSIEEVMMEDLVRLIRNGDMEKHSDPLTDREREVLQLIAEGKTSREIADILHVSVSTIDTHRKKIMDKLSIHNTAGLVKYAIKNKIIIE